ncbi:MAG: co-chaperone GroES [Patescibacteria group bacterium]
MKKQNSNVSGAGIAAKIIPLGDRVLLKISEDKNQSKTASGIFIPDTVDKEKPEQGKVVAVGEGKYIDGKLIPLNVKVGDKVVFSKYGYDEVKVGEEEFLIIKEDNILAIIK